MLIRIVKRIPAPVMDGFDVRHLRVDESYNVDSMLGRYLIIAGYAVQADETSDDKPLRRKRD